MTFARRTLLKALGLGALAAPRLARGAPPAPPPKRVVFFVQPHGHVPPGWSMPVPGPTTSFGQRDLTSLTVDELSPVLRPLWPYRASLLAIEGLSHLAALEDIAHIIETGPGDINNHNIAVADLLSASRSAQHPGYPCTGGAISVDQVLAQRLAVPGRFGSRVWGSDYIPNQAVAPFSFLGPSQPTPVVKRPADAYLDLLGGNAVSSTRALALARLRPSMLDSVAEEYRQLSTRLDGQGRAKLEAHAALVRDLEQRLMSDTQSSCSSSFDATGPTTRQFMQLVRLAFACDLTRVVTYLAPVPSCPEFGYPATADVHATYAHASVKGATSCGQVYSPIAERAMTDLGAWYAGHVAALAAELSAVHEADGSTLLDHTTIVWLTELGTPTHLHTGGFVVVLGGGGFFTTGRYVRFPATFASPLPNTPAVGPALNRLFVSVLQSLGQPDSAFGTSLAHSTAGELIPLSGALTELHAA